MDKNDIRLTGYLGKDAEVNIINGIKKATLSVATSKSYKNKDGEWQKNTTWHHVGAWGPIVDRIAHYKKGERVTLEGEITYRKYEKDGVVHFSTEIKVETIDRIVTSDYAKVSDTPWPQDQY